MNPHVVFVEGANIRDPVLPHADAFDAEAEGEAAVPLGVDPTVTEDIRMDHSRAEHF